MDFIKKLLLGAWLKPVWSWLNGKKTLSGLLITALSILDVLFGGSANVGLLMDILREHTFANPLLTSGEVLLVVGILHKIKKFFSGKTV